MKRSRQFLSKVNISNFKPSRIRLNSIRTKTIAIMLVMTLLPLGGTTQYLITQFRKAEEAKVKDYSMRIAQDKALELEMLIKEKVNMIQGMTRNDLVFKGQKISDIMNRLLVLDYYDINIDQINYITRDNIRYTPARYEYVVQEEQRAEQEAAEAEQAELEGNAEQAEQTEQTEQEELTGEENAEPVELLPFEERVERTGTKISDNPHFEKAKNEGVVVIGEVRNKTVTAQLLPIYIPFRDNEVQFNGAIEVLLASSNFYSRITSIALEESGYGFLIAQDGKFVTHKNTQYNTKRYDEFIQDEDSIHVFENTILKEDSGYVEYVDEEGQLLAASFMTIPSTQWRVVVVAPKEEIYATIDSLENLSRIAAAVVLLIVFVAGIIVANNQVKPIIRISRLMEKVAAGNLRERLPEKRKDEIGQLSRDINRTHESLSELIRELNGSIGQIALASEELSSISEQSAQASNQISASIENVAEGARTQEESADKVNQTTVEMSNEIAKIADTQQKVFETITVASADLFNGNEKIGNIIQQMNHIENSVKHSAQVVRELGAKSSEIGNVMTIISEVANQTNLLALNASIEAARAGEHGRGFAVVANEVKKLASKTQDSISDVSRIIGEIQDYIESTVKSMNEDLAEVSKGMQVTEETGEVFQNMIERVEQIVSQSEQVSEATNQISNGARQVVEVMNQYAQIGKEIVDSVSNVSAASEEQLAGMEEISASASRLDQMAKELKDLVSRFTV